VTAPDLAGRRILITGGAGFIRFGTIVGPSPGMRSHTAVDRSCWQAAMDEPLTVWRTVGIHPAWQLAVGDP
jgi:hypothetical protein